MTAFYGQEGEDKILLSLMGKPLIDNGFYVDVGAYHPVTFSNTKYFYDVGWHGINIDATPNSMLPFIRDRARDINLEVCVARVEGDFDYYLYNAGALNTLLEDRVALLAKNGYHWHSKCKVQARTLESILDEHLPLNVAIAFLNIDVEEAELGVLEGNNWDKYVPEFILAEIHHEDNITIRHNAVYAYLRSKGYNLVTRTFRTWFFKKVPGIKRICMWSKR